MLMSLLFYLLRTPKTSVELEMLNRFLIMYDFVFYCIVFILYFIVYTCADVICIKFLLTYLLTLM